MNCYVDCVHNDKPCTMLKFIFTLGAECIFFISTLGAAFHPLMCIFVSVCAAERGTSSFGYILWTCKHVKSGSIFSSCTFTLYPEATGNLVLGVSKQ
jgi:hypothetical protein